MIVKISYGNGFAGALRYCLDKPGARTLGAFSGVDHLTRLYGCVRGKRPRIKDPVMFMSLALHPSEYLDDRDWETVAQSMLERLGYDRNVYAVVRHTDEPHAHIHIIASRIRSDTLKVVPNTREKLRAAAIAADFEAQYGLIQAAYRGRKTGNTLSMGELAMAKARGEAPRRAIVKALVETALSDGADMPTFLRRCARYGVGVAANIGGDHVSGISFEVNGATFRGSKIGYSWKRIAGHTRYDPHQDLALLRQAPRALQTAPECLSGVVQQELVVRCARMAVKRPQAHLLAFLKHLQHRPYEPEEEHALEEQEGRRGRKV